MKENTDSIYERIRNVSSEKGDLVESLYIERPSSQSSTVTKICVKLSHTKSVSRKL